jgi:hypothetical protein
MDISRQAATTKGPAETFTGEAWIDPVTRGLPPSQLNVATVHFTLGARSAWHSHQGGKPCTSPKATAWCRYVGRTSLNSTPAMSYSRPTVKSTGTVPHRTTS